MNQFIFFLLKLIVIVSVLVIYFVYNYYKNKQIKQPEFPPWKSLCPELWEVVDKNKCKNVNKIGNCMLERDMVMDFNDPIFKDKKKGNYYKCKWAKECNVSWEGIDNLCI